ncbi:amidase domain-containing protein [Clostridium senegalense]
MKKFNKIFIAFMLTLFLSFSNIFLVFANPYYFVDEDMHTFEQSPDANEQLKNEFHVLLNDLFDQRNKSILSGDSEGLKVFYDLNKKVSLWAYESENKKIDYLKNWSQKQAVTFNNIQSLLKVRKVKEKEPGIYGIVCSATTEFDYSYITSPDIHNKFRLGTSHYINLKKENDKYVITKEWYTDPFADSLNLDNIKKSEEMKEYILSKDCPEINLTEKLEKAIDYAHKYCGIAYDDEYNFKYNKEYTNFNPQGGDCANFASQILYEGAGFKKNKLWNYEGRDGSKAWVNAQSFKNYMINSGRASYIAKGNYEEIYKNAYNLRPGDFVAYEKNGKIVHVSTVTGLDSKGYPLVTCHNTDRLLVPYDLGFSNSNIKFHLIKVHY